MGATSEIGKAFFTLLGFAIVYIVYLLSKLVRLRFILAGAFLLGFLEFMRAIVYCLPA